jgi:hypothetical protein
MISLLLAALAIASLIAAIAASRASLLISDELSIYLLPLCDLGILEVWITTLLFFFGLANWTGFLVAGLVTGFCSPG